VALLLRDARELDPRPDDAIANPGIRALGIVAAIVVFALGLWVVAFGIVTPGGGFQGGVVISGAILLVYVAAGYRDFLSVTPDALVELGESGGVGAYVLLGFAALAAEGAYLRNFLGIGDTGTLSSGGSTPLLNWATGVEVATAMVLLYGWFLRAFMVPASAWKP
jgi:multicomponent Na+:H+ antiporter subunit B